MLVNNKKEIIKDINNYYVGELKITKILDYLNSIGIKNIKDIIDSCQFELYSGNSINKNEDYHTKAINILKETDKLK